MAADCSRNLLILKGLEPVYGRTDRQVVRSTNKLCLMLSVYSQNVQVVRISIPEIAFLTGFSHKS